jgi:predicted DNA-binding transcriptional regulator AlpA
MLAISGHFLYIPNVLGASRCAPGFTMKTSETSETSETALRGCLDAFGPRMINDLETPLLTVSEVAAFLRVPPKTLYEWRSTGKGPRGRKVGRFVRYAATDVVRWLDALN